MKTEKEQQPLLRQLPLLAVLAALLFGLQVALAPVPNIEVVSLLIVLYTRQFGKRTLMIIYAFVLLEGLLYGFGHWFINYLYIWAVLWAVAMLFCNMESLLGWAVLLGFYGLVFGALCAIPYLVMGGPGMAVSYFLSGIPFDLLHCGGNVVVALVLFKPLSKLLALLSTGKALPAKEGEKT